MRVGVVGDLMAARQDFGNEMRILFRAFADEEKCGPRLEAIEQIEDRDRVNGRRPVVDREPDFRFICFKGAQDGTEPLAVRNERRVKEEDVRQKNRGEGGGEIDAHEEKSEERR